MTIPSEAKPLTRESVEEARKLMQESFKPENYLHYLRTKMPYDPAIGSIYDDLAEMQLKAEIAEKVK